MQHFNEANLKFSYMGTKRSLGLIVSDAVKSSRDGALLDLFCGIGNVGQNIGPDREIWANDVQLFAHSMAKALFTSEDRLKEGKYDRYILEYYSINIDKLLNNYKHIVENEKKILNTSNIHDISEFYSKTPSVASNNEVEKERISRCYNNNKFPFNLFTITYPGTYLGVFQCLEVDSLCYSIHILKKSNVINAQEHNWMILALCKAISICSTITGHFAQYLNINNNNIKYYLRKRKKSIYSEFISTIPQCIPAGDNYWRTKNKVFNKDALGLLDELIELNMKPAIIYADPPYTEDQYSRFYHLYETLILYDYPSVFFKARYRDNRFRSCFSVKTLAHKSISALIEKSHKLGSDLILSYPLNGLLGDSIENVPKLVKNYYKKCELVKTISHTHSSFGSLNSKSKNNIIELLFKGYN